MSQPTNRHLYLFRSCISIDGCTSSSHETVLGLWLKPVVISLFCLFSCCVANAVQLQIEEITRRLRSGELGIPANPGDR